MHEEILEAFVGQSGLSVDREAGVIRNVQFHAPHSGNGYDYSDRAMDDLLELYKSIDVVFDHQSTQYEKMIGCPRNLRKEVISGRTVIKGDLECNKKKPHYEALMEDAELRPHLIKLSHEIPGTHEGKRAYEIKRRRGQKPLIDRVHKVRRIALIIGDGGVNRGLHENKNEGNQMDEIRCADDVKKQFPAVWEQIIQEVSPDILEGCSCKLDQGAIAQVAQLTADLADRDSRIKGLEEELAEFRAKEQRALREEKILDKAKELKKECRAELLEALMNYPDTEDGWKSIEKLLSIQADIKEDVNDGDPEPDPPAKKVGQTPGVGGTPKQTPTAAQSRALRSKSLVRGYIEN